MKPILILIAAMQALAFAQPNPDSPFVKKWSGHQCVRWGDDSALSDAEGRLRWSHQCVPDYEVYYKLAESYSKKQKTRPLYPVFGVSDGDGGFKNPRTFTAPTRPVQYEENCYLPNDYILAGFCEALPEF